MPRKAAPSIQQLFDLTGRVALITGASGHLGVAMASALAEAGCRVVVASRKLETIRGVESSGSSVAPPWFRFRHQASWAH